MAWLKVEFVIPRNSVEPASQSLLDAGAIATSLLDAGCEEIVETSPVTTPLWSQVRVEALFKVGASLQYLRSLLGEHGAEDVEVTFVQEANWESEWRSRTSNKKFGRLHVLPRESSTEIEGPLVRLDPGLAFGTGEHPTTAMCLNWLAHMDLCGKSVLDFGCGSGILGLAASKLGAAHVEAIDSDANALEVTRQNAIFNRVDLTVGKTIRTDRRFEVVVANILLNTLVEYASDLTHSIDSGGVIGLTGLLASQRESIVKAFPSINFEQPVQEDEWILMTGRKSLDDR